MNSMGSMNPKKMFRDQVPSGYKAGSIQQFTPQQMKLFSQLFGHVGPESYTSRLAEGSEDIFNEIEAPALRQFSALQGGMASRFSGMGGQGALSSRGSSGFQNTMNQAGMDFASQLQSQRQGLQRQALQDLMGMSNQLLGQRPFERTLTQKPQQQSSGWGSLIGTGLGAAGGFALGGPMGAYYGGSLGYAAGSGF